MKKCAPTSSSFTPQTDMHHPYFDAQATRDAPTLWERHDAEVRKEAAKRIALSTIAEKVFGAGSVGAERESWRGSGVDKLFDEEERALLCCAD